MELEAAFSRLLPPGLNSFCRPVLEDDFDPPKETTVFLFGQKKSRLCPRRLVVDDIGERVSQSLFYVVKMIKK